MLSALPTTDHGAWQKNSKNLNELLIGRQIMHRSIRLGELNLLKFIAKLYLQQFGGKFKECVMERGVPVHKKIKLGL